MNKIYLLTVLCLFSTGIFAQSATNFNVPNCAGVNYDLFSALDAGKVVVIGWAMPCGSCVLPLKTTYNVVQSYATNFPGRVEMLLCDDYANTPCNSLELWANSNGLTNTNRFSNGAIKMQDYGSVGMPKVVVIGGPDHKVYYNADNSVDHVALQKAINNAISIVLGSSENSASSVSLKVAPNPVSNAALVSFTLSKASEIRMDVINEKGQAIRNVVAGFKEQGAQQIELSTTGLKNGIYVIRLQHSEGTQMLKFSVVH
jgi:hypothetical protein